MGSKRERRHTPARPKTVRPQTVSPDPLADIVSEELPFVTITNMITHTGAVIEGLERMMLPKLREVIFTEPMLVVTVICRCGITQGATYQENPEEIYAKLTHAVHCVGGES
jgi:hypothetical protein